MENVYKKNFKPEHFCHHDLHKGNLMKNGTKLFIVDFDHADYGYRNFGQIKF